MAGRVLPERPLPSGRRPKLSAREVAKLHRWAAIGTNQSQAAAHFGVQQSTMRRYLLVEHKRPYRGEA